MPLTAIVLKNFLTTITNSLDRVYVSNNSYSTLDPFLGNDISFESVPSISTSPGSIAIPSWTTPTTAIPSVSNTNNSPDDNTVLLYLVKPTDYARGIFFTSGTIIVAIASLTQVNGSTTGMPLYIPNIKIEVE